MNYRLTSDDVKFMKNIDAKPSAAEYAKSLDTDRQSYWEKDAKETDTDTLQAMITEWETSNDYSPVALEEYKKELKERAKADKERNEIYRQAYED